MTAEKDLPDETPQRSGSLSHQGAEAIRSEYRRLDDKWMRMQYQTTLWIILMATAAEIIMFFILHDLRMVHTTPAGYFRKYVAAPFLADAGIMLLSGRIMNGRRCSQRCRIYAVSLGLSLCCFVLYAVHDYFPAVTLLFSAPIFLTVVYADRTLTTVVFLCCAVGKVAADLLITWDSSKTSVFASRASVVDFALSLLFLLGLFLICQVIIRMEQQKNNVGIELELEKQRLQEAAVTDALTGVGNRQGLREAFARIECGGRRRCMLAMADLDGLKALNDRFGHAAGDECLAALGKLLRRMAEESAPETPVQAFRFGGDEFCLFFTGQTPSQVRTACEKLQADFRDVRRGGVLTTLSIGVADYRFGEKPTELLERADQALYEAKRKKDCVCFA
jgi:diguanylate cyclase (GGDEF)-like protein